MDAEQQIDWAKPLETVPDALNPQPVPCSFVRFDPDGDAVVNIDGDWLSTKEGNRGNTYWYFEEDGTTCSWLPALRNVDGEPA